MLRLLLLVCTLPFLELWLMLALGARIGLVPTVAVVIGAGLAGAALARHQGLRALQKVATELQAGRMPAEGLLDGAGLLVAGVLLLLPGLISDVLGLLLLVPPVRRGAVLWALGWSRRKIQQGMRDGTITVHAVRVDPAGLSRGWPLELEPPRDDRRED